MYSSVDMTCVNGITLLFRWEEDAAVHAQRTVPDRLTNNRSTHEHVEGQRTIVLTLAREILLYSC